MSFVYAMNDMAFLIMSDTRIELNDDYINLWESEDKRRLVRQIGLIKSVIVSPNLVICYSGNRISKAAELLRKINADSDSLEEIVSAAFEIHNTSEEDAIEFIVAYCDEESRELISI